MKKRVSQAVRTRPKNRSGKTSLPTVDDFIAAQAQNMTSARLKELALFSTSLAAKLKTPQAVGRLQFQQEAHLLLRVLNSTEVRTSRDPLPTHLAEIGVAAAYLLKGADLIPDQVPEIGLADDEIILNRVFRRHPELNQLLKNL